MTDPLNAAAPALASQGERVEIRDDNHVSLVSGDFAEWASADTRAEVCELAARRARLAREQERHQASAALDELLAVIYPTREAHPPEGWELAWVRQMVAQGFDADYLAARYALLRKVAS